MVYVDFMLALGAQLSEEAELEELLATLRTNYPRDNFKQLEFDRHQARIEARKKDLYELIRSIANRN